jgi:hypothetical protein
MLFYFNDAASTVFFLRKHICRYCPSYFTTIINGEENFFKILFCFCFQIRTAEYLLVFTTKIMFGEKGEE